MFQELLLRSSYVLVCFCPRNVLECRSGLRVFTMLVLYCFLWLRVLFTCRNLQVLPLGHGNLLDLIYIVFSLHINCLPLFAIMVHLSQSLKALITAALLSHVVVCHPGHDLTQEIAQRNAFYQNSKRDLTHCNDFLRKRGMDDKQRKRRQAAIEKARVERGLPQSQYLQAQPAITELIDFQSAISLTVTLPV